MDASHDPLSPEGRSPFDTGLGSPLIDATSLLERLSDPQLRVLDARFELADPGAGRRAFAEGHIPGAIFVDLDEDLASPPAFPGGRHPLPDMARLVPTLGERGVGDDHDVVVVDEYGAIYAARAWWLLRYAGHRRVWVLDGGLRAYLEAGGALTTEATRWPPANLTLQLQAGMVADADYVRRHIGDPRVLTLDARAPERFRGEHEPLDPKAGRVPGALNRPHDENLAGGRFLPPDVLLSRFSVAQRYDEVVHYCGSGVSAAHNVLAMELAGLPAGRLYAGSWSDWCARPELPVETGPSKG